MRASSFFTRNPEMKIQCLLGPTEQVVFGETYNFAADEYGRCVATIHDGRHASVFTCHEHYVEVPDVPVDLPELILPTGPTAEELAIEEAERAKAEADRIEAARLAADEAQARAAAAAAEAEAAAKADAAAQEAKAAAAADEAEAAEAAAKAAAAAAAEAKAKAEAAAATNDGEQQHSTSDNLDAAATDSADAVTLPTPKTRRAGPRKAAAK